MPKGGWGRGGKKRNKTRIEQISGSSSNTISSNATPEEVDPVPDPVIVAPLDGSSEVSVVPKIILQSSQDNAWQLPTGYYTQAKVSPTIIHPRPDGETNSWERCRMAPAGIEWRIPVVMQGGAWPFNYVLTTAPSGATIGENYGDTDYGIISWSNPTTGTHNFTVRVRTQDYGRTAGSADSSGEYSVSFTLIVSANTDNTKFVFCDDTATDDTGTGAIGDPWKTLAGVESNSTGGKQLFFRAGTYATSATTGGLNLRAATDAAVWIGYPGEAATIDFSGSSGEYMFCEDGTFVANLTCSGGNTSVSEYWYFRSSDGDRKTMFENTFDGFTNDGGEGSFGNHSAFTCFATSNIHQYISVVNCTLKNFTGLGNGGGMSFFSTSNAVIEGCTVQGFSFNDSGTWGLISKGYCSDFTMRNLDLWTSNSFTGGPGGALCHNQGPDGGAGNFPSNNEICWSKVKTSAASRDYDFAVTVGIGTTTADIDEWTSWAYRCTFAGNLQFRSYQRPATMNVEHCVMMGIDGDSNDTYAGNEVGTLNTVSNVLDTFGNRTNYLNDTTGLLTSGYLTTAGLERGERGHEVKP